MLKQDKVCDLIVEAIRKNQHMLVIPKTLSISVALKRLEEKKYVKKKLVLFSISMTSTAAQLEIQNMIGVHDSMATFTGHQKSS
jgi:hypothetical protein